MYCAAMCKWVPSVSFCTATVEGPEGDQYVATNVAAGACFSNQNEALGGGCRIGTLQPAFSPSVACNLASVAPVTLCTTAHTTVAPL